MVLAFHGDSAEEGRICDFHTGRVKILIVQAFGCRHSLGHDAEEFV